MYLPLCFRLCLGFLCLGPLLAYGQVSSAAAQVRLAGTITDSETGDPVPFVQIVAYRYERTDVLAFQMSDEAGRYELRIPAGETLVTLKTSRLNYQPLEKDLVLDVSREQSFTLDFTLTRQAYDLETVEVTTKLPPLIVKQDTIIYHVEHWTDETDQSLEAVLDKIPGIEVLADGELKVNGQNVDKVLVNGEEISDGGAALLTRTLTPDRVQSVEVRFKEQNQQLRESILAQNDLVVLDIKLKDDFDHSLFGRLTGTLGLRQEELAAGGVAKVFSLREAVKLQLIGEADDFGDQTISLAGIKNLGSEAFAAIFDVPADFDRLRENPEYNREIYGFREYTRRDIRSLGLTGKVNVSPAMSLFFGSYNHWTLAGARREVTQTFIGDTLAGYRFTEWSDDRVVGSKNKVELTFDRPNVKGRYNFNAVFGTVDNGQAQAADVGQRFDFQSMGRSSEYLHNLFFEYQFSDQSGLQFQALLARGKEDQAMDYQHDNPFFALFFDSTAQALPQRLRQDIPRRREQRLAELFYQTTLGTQFLQVGVRAMDQSLWSEKRFTLPGGEGLATRFDGPSNRLDFQQLLPYLSHQLSLGVISFRNKVGLAFNRYPLGNGQVRSAELLEWSSQLSVDLNEDDDFTLTYNRQTAHFPLSQLFLGDELINFQTIAVPGRYPIRPRPERVLTAGLTTFALGRYGIALELAGVAGQSQNGASVAGNGFGLIEEYYDQLTSRYLVALCKVGKVFSELPLQLRLEPSYIRHQQENRLGDGSTPKVTTEIASVDFRAFTHFREAPYDVEAKLKYSGFAFSAENGGATFRQNMWNAALQYKHNLASDRLWILSRARYAAFTGGQSANLWLLDVELGARVGHVNLGLQVQNLFDARYFIAQQISPAIFSDSRQELFGRYGKLSISFDLN